LDKEGQLQQKFSALLGIAGGVVDLVAGIGLLQPVGMQQPMMVPTAAWGGYFLLILGVIVLVTGLYLLTSRMMENRSILGVLMLVYGVVMLVLGVSMIGQVFSMMQGWSTLSGSVMIILGVAMLYSGYGMMRA
jgi:uncharacterized membrane protein HdeD (DUF308 family)